MPSYLRHALCLHLHAAATRGCDLVSVAAAAMSVTVEQPAGIESSRSIHHKPKDQPSTIKSGTWYLRYDINWPVVADRCTSVLFAVSVTSLKHLDQAHISQTLGMATQQGLSRRSLVLHLRLIAKLAEVQCLVQRQCLASHLGRHSIHLTCLSGIDHFTLVLFSTALFRLVLQSVT